MQILKLLKVFIKSYISPNTKTYSDYFKKGTIKNTARYCYSVWLRHMVIANKNGLNIKPKIVAEIGPGDSLGLALCGLITGAKEYIIFDSKENVDKNINYVVFDELVKLFKNMEEIPNNNEFPKIKPQLKNYDFPLEIYSKEYLSKMLRKERLEEIRRSIDKFNSEDSKIKYFFNFGKKFNSMFDLIISHAVLEHIDNIDEFFQFMRNSLKESGFVSHQVDLKSHEITSTWDGHWRFSKFYWQLLRGKRQWFINRLPLSKYMELFNKYSFSNNYVERNVMKASYERSKLTKDFKFMSEEDRETAGFFIQATKNNS